MLVSFRGDAHKLYLKLRSMHRKNESLKHIKELEEVQEVRAFYKSIDTDTLRLVYYRMIKEKNGSGIVPIFVTAIPWFIFLFASKLQEFLFHEGSLLWLPFSIVYLLALTISVIVHFREKAWAVLHIEIIQDIIGERNEQGIRQ
jgi:hypothetical protein